MSTAPNSEGDTTRNTTTGNTTGGGRGNGAEDNSTRTNNRGGRGNNLRTTGTRNSNYDPALRNFEGAEPDVKGVLCLPSEKVDKKVTFDEFRIKIGQYVDRNYDNSDDIAIVLEK